MTKKTRIRVARIAAGAVIAAGASLMVTGVAQADPVDPPCDIVVDPECGEDPEVPEEPEEPEEPEVPEEPEEPAEPEEPGEPEEPEVPAEPEVPTDPEEPGGEDPVEEPTGNPTTPGGGKGGDGGGNAPAGGAGVSVQEEGSSALTGTGDAPAKSAQGNGKELAETGAAEMTFLVIGAATMIAGGVGFRVLPRLMGNRGAAAA
ncbi:LPXTG cell wall anchor domain-containing protein [Streptomyces prasinus]|uniref:LPXTG cell wall anchor domain-containing protein n=1 Tax=Streptomyces prasinus TaxID=67345 RepID=UPI00331CD3B1